MGTSLDYLMFAVIVGGIGLCVAYFRDGYIAWRKHRAAAQRNEIRMRELHAERLVRQEGGPTQSGHRERTADPASSWTDGATDSDAYR
jgi:hypothetical protein